MKEIGCTLVSFLISAIRWVTKGKKRKETVSRPPLWSTTPTATSLPQPEGKKVRSTESGGKVEASEKS